MTIEEFRKLSLETAVWRVSSETASLLTRQPIVMTRQTIIHGETQEDRDAIEAEREAEAGRKVKRYVVVWLGPIGPTHSPRPQAEEGDDDCVRDNDDDASNGRLLLEHDSNHADAQSLGH